jgi:uncharacterized protein
MMNPFEQHGAFSWCELMSSDAPTAKEFYGKLFGWAMDDQDVQGMPYTVVGVAGTNMGGMMTMPTHMQEQGVPPHWGLYVTVEDVDASVKLVQELGGQVKMPPMEIPDVGRFAVIQDPQGAILSIITYAQKPAV